MDMCRDAFIGAEIFQEKGVLIIHTLCLQNWKCYQLGVVRVGRGELIATKQFKKTFVSILPVEEIAQFGNQREFFSQLQLFMSS